MNTASELRAELAQVFDKIKPVEIKPGKEASMALSDEQIVQLSQVAELTPETLARFAALVRNEALEEAAGVCIETGSTKGSCDAAFDIADACAAAIRAMKEQA